MLTVAILVNGHPLYSRSAVRIKGESGQTCEYECDDGSVIVHDYNDGAVALAHKLLDTIKEPSMNEKKQKKLEKLQKLIEFYNESQG